MGLFDELKGSASFEPEKRIRTTIERELEERRSQWTRPGYFYRGGGDFLLQHGQFWGGRELPAQYEDYTGPNTMCFDNAMSACRADSSLRFVEGVYSTGRGHYTPHAWAIDPDDKVVELTFPTRNLDRYRHAEGNLPILPPQHWGYWGVIFPMPFVIWHEEEHGLPMLDRPAGDKRFAHMIDVGEEHDYPLLKVRFDPTRTQLP